jgi:hypothetical protein
MMSIFDAVTPMYSKEEAAAIFELGKHLWERAFQLYKTDGIKPAPLMELAHELAQIAHDDFVLHREL